MTVVWLTSLIVLACIAVYAIYWFRLHNGNFGRLGRILVTPEGTRATIATLMLLASGVGAWIIVATAMAMIQVESPLSRVTTGGWAERLRGSLHTWADASWVASGRTGESAAWRVWSIEDGVWPNPEPEPKSQPTPTPDPPSEANPAASSEAQSESDWAPGALLLRATGSDLVAEIANAGGSAPLPQSAGASGGDGVKQREFDDVVLAISPIMEQRDGVAAVGSTAGSASAPNSPAGPNVRRTTILAIADGGLTGMRTVGLRLDEEAVASWYLDGLASRASQPLSDEARARAIRFISDLLRFAIGEAGASSSLANSTPSPADGADGGGTGPAAADGTELVRPREAASTLRWPIWVHGSNGAASMIHFLIYWVSLTAILQILIRWLCLKKGVLVRLAKLFRSNTTVATAIRDLNITYCYEDLVRDGVSPEAASEATQARWDARRWLVTSLEAIIPALGFVGTIWGLGEAFGSVGIISKIESIQRESLMKVLLDLGTAFSTTFVALILSGLVVIPLNMMLCSMEDRVLLRASRAPGGEDD